MATETDKVNTGALGTLLVVGLFSVVAIALAVTALVRSKVEGVADGRAGLTEQGYHDMRREQTDKLDAAPTWTDKAKGLVSIPIDRAKQRVLNDLAHDPESATPPAPASAAPSGEAAPTGSAAPAESGKAAQAPTPPEPTPAKEAARDKPKANPVAASKPTAPAAASTAPATPTPAPAPTPAPKPTDG